MYNDFPENEPKLITISARKAEPSPATRDQETTRQNIRCIGYSVTLVLPIYKTVRRKTCK